MGYQFGLSVHTPDGMLQAVRTNLERPGVRPSRDIQRIMRRQLIHHINSHHQDPDMDYVDV